MFHVYFNIVDGILMTTFLDIRKRCSPLFCIICIPIINVFIMAIEQSNFYFYNIVLFHFSLIFTFFGSIFLYEQMLEHVIIYSSIPLVHLFRSFFVSVAVLIRLD